MATVWARKGGAERLILELLDRLDDEYRTTLGFVRPVAEEERTIRWDGPTVGLREILFGRWDIIHTHLFLPGLLVRVRRMWDGSFRWVHTVHYRTYRAFRWRRLKRWLDRRFVFPAADVLVAVSPAGRESLEGFPRVRLVENAIPLEPATEAEGSAGTDGPRPKPEAGSDPAAGGAGGEGRGAGPVLGTVAHLRREKGLDDLVRAVPLLRARFPGLRVRIAGDGPEGPRLRALVREAGLGGSVEICGFVEDLDRFYRSLDVYVQPSRSEVFGLAALESMRYSLPVVAAAIDFLPELLGRGRFGELVSREGDFPSRLAAAVETVLDDAPAYRTRSREGLAHWRQALSVDEMVQKYRYAYRAALLPRVCMVQPVVTHGYGGLARQVLIQSRELARRGHAVYVVERTDPELRADAAKAERWSHVEVRGAGRVGGGDRGARSPATRIRGLRFVAGAVVQLWRIRHRVDLVHAHQLYSPTLVGAAARLLFGTPLVVKVTSSGDLGERSQIRRLPFRRLRRMAFRRVDRLLVLSEDMGREMEELGFGPERIRLVPNSVEIPQEARDRRFDDASRPYRVLFTGRLSTEKRLDLLLEAGGILAERGDAVDIDLVGEADPDRDATPGLREMEAALPPACTVRFHGFRKDVDRFYREADCFVLPSDTEGLSNALLEAMARGLPCVVSDIPQNRFPVDDGRAGLLFRRGDARSLAAELARLVEDRRRGGPLHRRLGRAARERARSDFSVEAVVDRIEAIYREVLEERLAPDPARARSRNDRARVP